MADEEQEEVRVALCQLLPFKKRKLHEVGNRQYFETVRVSNFEDDKSGRLKGGFKDISLS
jgi:hypothetical protein